ncbi:hypothetical protein DBR28_00945 [Chryseobacterium sp. HMWF028]|nr:hypothetical protein DBR28_00945 [Chryseobacterium sp. HMWF028]
MENLKPLESDPNYTLHLQTVEYDFFCDIEESDENGSVKMFDKSGKLLSDNHFGYSELYEILAERRNEIIFSSEDMKYNMAQMDLERDDNQKSL